ncbi:hypothetical protein B0H13DRAFT_2488354 [Mycena leptocephala]|nr:hypothetical protein B0H13DRAFT_2488354 [Mycena leptocephala]
MSSFNVFGFFALTAGKRVTTQPPGATILFTTITTRPVSNPPLNLYAPVPDNTIAFVVAKAFAAIGKPVELEALYMSAMPGMKQFQSVQFYLRCRSHSTESNAQVLADNTKVFTVTTSDYVGGSPKNSTVHDETMGQRPVPRAQSCTQFLGICDGFADSGLLALRSSISRSASSGTDPYLIPTHHDPHERKKYVAVGLTSTPTTETTPMAVTGMGANTTSDAFIGPPSSSHAVAGPGPSTSSAHETRSRKRRAPSGSPSPLPDDLIPTLAKKPPSNPRGKRRRGSN